MRWVHVKRQAFAVSGCGLRTTRCKKHPSLILQNLNRCKFHARWIFCPHPPPLRNDFHSHIHDLAALTIELQNLRAHTLQVSLCGDVRASERGKGAPSRELECNEDYVRRTIKPFQPRGVTFCNVRINSGARARLQTRTKLFRTAYVTGTLHNSHRSWGDVTGCCRTPPVVPNHPLTHPDPRTTAGENETFVLFYCPAEYLIFGFINKNKSSRRRRCARRSPVLRRWLSQRVTPLS